MLIFGQYLWHIKPIFVGITLLLSMIIGYFDPPPPPEYHEPVSVQEFVMFDALLRLQDVTTDGRHLYFSQNFGLTKTDLTGKRIITKNLIAIPPRLLLKGCDHIGGISYHDGKIYAALEDSGTFEHLYIVVYNARTLRPVKYAPVALGDHEFGIPWVTADREKGLLYSARRDDFTTLNIYDAETLELTGYLELGAPVSKAQGGEVHDGVLYVAVSRERHGLYAINLTTGQVQVVFNRYLGGAKGQGLMILPRSDGSFFHVLDEGENRVNMRLRSYAFDPAGLAW